MARTRFLWINFFFAGVLTGLSLPAFGQTLSVSAIVAQRGSRQAAPFVTVAVKNTSRGTVTDAAGSFTIQAKLTDSLLLTSVGFKAIVVSASTIADTIYLDEEAKFLNEFTVSSTKRTKKVDIGNLKDKTFLATGGANQYAKLFINPAAEGVLDAVTFCLQPEAKKYGRYMTVIMVRIYENNNGVPGRDLLLEKVIVPIKENQKQASIDLSKYNIPFPESGLFVGFDFIGFYDSSEIFTPYSKLKTPANLRVEFAKKDESDTFSKFFGTSWQKVLHTDRNGNKSPISSKMSITVSY